MPEPHLRILKKVHLCLGDLDVHGHSAPQENSRICEVAQEEVLVRVVAGTSQMEEGEPKSVEHARIVALSQGVAQILNADVGTVDLPRDASGFPMGEGEPRRRYLEVAVCRAVDFPEEIVEPLFFRLTHALRPASPVRGGVPQAEAMTNAIAGR